MYGYRHTSLVLFPPFYYLSSETSERKEREGKEKETGGRGEEKEREKERKVGRLVQAKKKD